MGNFKEGKTISYIKLFYFYLANRRIRCIYLCAANHFIKACQSIVICAWLNWLCTPELFYCKAVFVYLYQGQITAPAIGSEYTADCFVYRRVRFFLRQRARLRLLRNQAIPLHSKGRVPLPH